MQPQEDVNEQKSANDATFKAPEAVPTATLETTCKSKNSTLEESSMASSILSSTTNTSSVVGKKPRKKKDGPPHRPIKVERFSDLDPKPSPVASRTRHSGSMSKRISQHEAEEAASQEQQSTAKEGKRPGTVYEDAVETPPSRNSKAAAVNETVNLGPGPAADATINLGPVPGDATFSANPAQTTFQVTPGQTTFILDSGNPNATVTLNKDVGAMCDATFDINSTSKNDKEEDVAGHRSFETAKDSSVPNDDSLITEDESCDPSPPPVPAKQKSQSSAKPGPASAKASSTTKANYKMPTRTNELFK